MRLRSAFSMIEVIFVIVVMGIIAKFGAEFLNQAYTSFIFSNINNRLQAQSESAVEQIAAKLQYRIKDSIIAKQADGTFQALSSANNAGNIILEWVGSDVDGFRGDVLPLWSGIIDVDLDIGQNVNITSPQSNLASEGALIASLSSNNSGIADSALYFIGSNNDINGYGWDGVALATQDDVMHPIQAGANNDQFQSSNADNFAGTDVFEFYKLAWTAYAVEIQNNGDLVLYYDYQPWNGEVYTDGQNSLIMENVQTFKFVAIGSLVKIQVCTSTTLVENYAICKEKTIY